jgi:hypothetical protein
MQGGLDVGLRMTGRSTPTEACVLSPKACEIHVKLSRDDLARLQELAGESGESTSYVVRALVRRAHFERFGERKVKVAR